MFSIGVLHAENQVVIVKIGKLDIRVKGLVNDSGTERIEKPR